MKPLTRQGKEYQKRVKEVQLVRQLSSKCYEMGAKSWRDVDWAIAGCVGIARLRATMRLLETGEWNAREYTGKTNDVPYSKALDSLVSTDWFHYRYLTSTAHRSGKISNPTSTTLSNPTSTTLSNHNW